MEKRKVTVTITRTYHKTAVVELDIDNDIQDDKLIALLSEDDNLNTQYENAIGNATLNGGETEYEFQDPENNFGGHL